MKKLMILTLVPLCFSSAACGPAGGPSSSAPAPPAPTAGTAIPASSTDAIALGADVRRLAGISREADGSPADPVWGRHNLLMDELWTQLEDRHLRAMRTWAESALAGLADPRAPLVYPFSGPDLPSAVQFFPAASTYVLVGLEPPGRIPRLGELRGDALDGELERLRGGLENLTEAGYFVTTQMQRDFVANRLEGVLPVLYMFLGRAGLIPTAVHFIDLDDSGRVRRLDTVTDRTATAVAIELDSGGKRNTSRRTLYYFSLDLSNDGLESEQQGFPPGAFAAFLENLEPFNVYLKSASYLLHMEAFTRLKSLLLAEAGAVLQDDSGIPLRDFDRRLFELRFFGTYTQTLPSYTEWYQEDLREAFALDPDVEPLDFRVGYHSKIGGSCLIWAERQETP